MSAPVVPTPEVERKERVEVVPVPPMWVGEVMEVEAVRVVKAPVLGVVEPMVPGATQVAPIRDEALIVPELA